MKIVFVVFLCIILIGCTQTQDETITIGAIISLSGSAAITGEMLQQGMELAVKDLEKQGIIVNVIYEDSATQANQGISAYKKLTSIDNVDVVFSAYSRVSIPLIPLADEDEIPLIMTLVAAKGAAQKSPYAFRYFSDETQFSKPHFSVLEEKGYRRIGGIFVNDEFGNSIIDAAQGFAIERGMIFQKEPYEVDTLDFRAQLTKLKANNPDAILMISESPASMITLVQQAHELDIEAELFEASAFFNIPETREAVKDVIDNVHTIAYSSDFGLTGEQFHADFKQTFKEDPLWMAPFGYGMIDLIGKATNGEKLTGPQIRERILALQTHDSINGLVTIQPNGEINPETFSVRIENNELVEN